MSIHACTKGVRHGLRAGVRARRYRPTPVQQSAGCTADSGDRGRGRAQNPGPARARVKAGRHRPSVDAGAPGAARLRRPAIATTPCRRPSQAAGPGPSGTRSPAGPPTPLPTAGRPLNESDRPGLSGHAHIGEDRDPGCISSYLRWYGTHCRQPTCRNGTEYRNMGGAPGSLDSAPVTGWPHSVVAAAALAHAAVNVLESSTLPRTRIEASVRVAC